MSSIKSQSPREINSTHPNIVLEIAVENQPVGSETVPSADLRSVLALYHERADGLEGVFVIFAKQSGSEKAIIRQFSIGDVDGMIELALSLSQDGHNVWFAPAVFRAGLSHSMRGGHGDVIAVLGLVVDDDEDKPGKSARVSDPRPTFTVVTSTTGDATNRQYHFVFDRPLAAAEAKDAAKALKAKFGGDDCSCVTAQVYALPATLNWPTPNKIRRGRSPEPQRRTLESVGPIHNYDDFRCAIGDAPSRSTRERHMGAGRSPIHMPDEIVTLVRDGVPQGQRSEAIFKVVRTLVVAGADDASIASILLNPEYGISEKPRQNGADWVESEILRIRGKILASFKRSQTSQIIRNSQHNVDLALELLGITLRYDSFRDQLLIDGIRGIGPVLEDPELDELWLLVDKRFGFSPNIDYFRRVIVNRARKNSFNPVCDYLDGLQWDGIARLDTWLTTYGGAEDTPYTRAVGPLALMAAVRRVRRPGCKFDEMLVLISEEGKNKSSALALMAVQDDWFTDSFALNLGSKETIEQVRGKWIVECADLAGVRKGDIGAMKALLSRRTDRARLAYGRLSIDVPRQNVFIGTTNETSFLKSNTGNRRFWPVQVQAFDLEALKRDRDQIWAEAAAREAQGASIRLDPKLYQAARDEQEARRVEDPLLHQLEAHLGDKSGKIRALDIWAILGISQAQRTQDMNNRVGSTMKELGWDRKKLRFEGKQGWGYVKGTGQEREAILHVVRDDEGDARVIGKLDK